MRHIADHLWMASSFGIFTTPPLRQPMIEPTDHDDDDDDDDNEWRLIIIRKTGKGKGKGQRVS